MGPVPPLGRRPLDVLLLHPAGSRDPQHVSLAIGFLEWTRLWLESRSLATALWPETAVDGQGNRRFILRTTPWGPADVRRKVQLAPSAEGVLYLNFADEATPRASLTLEDRRGDTVARLDVALDPERIFENLPGVVRELLRALDHPMPDRSPAELFQTSDSGTALAALYALERMVAFHAGVGRDEPRRLFEPVLQCLAREATHPIARECLTRLAIGMTEGEKGEGPAAACEALERWCDLAPLSPAPAFHLAVVRQRAGSPEPARAAFEEALRRDPLYVPAVQGYAEWLASHGFVDQGIGVLRQAFGRTGFEGSLCDQAGCILANAGRLLEAEPLFRRAIVTGGPPTAHANLARSLLAQDREEEALEILSTGLAVGIDSTQLELLAQFCRRPTAAASRARAILRGRIAEGSSEEEIQRALVACSLEFDGPEAAAPQARRLLEITAKPDHLRYAYYVLLRSRVPDFEQRWDKAVLDVTGEDPAGAERFFREVIEAEPAFGRAQFLLAAALERLGRIHDAVTHIEQASITEGDDPGVLDLLARARSETGNLAGAAQAHHRAATLAPKDARILHNAAVSLLRAGYPDEGVGLARISLALDPNQPELSELLRGLSVPRKKGFGALLERARRKIARPASGPPT